MGREAKYYRVFQGVTDKDGFYRQYEEPTVGNIDELLDWGLAQPINMLEYFEGKAKLGSANHMIDIDGVSHMGSAQFDST